MRGKPYYNMYIWQSSQYSEDIVVCIHIIRVLRQNFQN